MSSPQIVKNATFDIDKVGFKPCTVNRNGKGKTVPITYGGAPLMIQTPLILTWGVNERIPQEGSGGRISYDMSLQFNKNTNSVIQFRKNIEALQSKILKAAEKEKAPEWFGKSKQNAEVLKELMYPILKHRSLKDSDGNWTSEPDYDSDPTMKIKLGYWEGKFNVELYDMDKNLLFLPDGYGNEETEKPQGSKTPMDLIPKGSNVIAIIKCTGLWFAGGRFGVTWRLEVAHVKQPFRLKGSGKSPIDYDSGDENDLMRLARKDKEMAEAENAKEAEEDQDEVTVDSDGGKEERGSDGEEDEAVTFRDEEEEEPEEAIVVEPPKKKKKVVRRKKKKKSTD